MGGATVRGSRCTGRERDYCRVIITSGRSAPLINYPTPPPTPSRNQVLTHKPSSEDTKANLTSFE